MNLVFWFFFLIILLPRGSRWLAIAQQKEYRLDRLLLFLKSKEGQSELLLLLPKKEHLTKTGFKRPVRTGRIYILFLLELLFLFVLFFLTLNSSSFVLFLILAALYVAWPAIVALSILPTAIVSYLITQIVLFLASQKVKKAKPTVIGVTGSYGKSSTKYLLEAVLKSQNSVFITPKSYNTKLSVALSVLRNYQGEKIAILEFGAYKKGEIATIARFFPPSIAVITGFSPQHLGLFGSLDDIISAKSELVKALPAGAPVFCNDYDSQALIIAGAGKDNKIVKVSQLVQFGNISLDEQGYLSFVWNNFPIVTKIVGRHYLLNLKLAVAVGEHFGVSAENIAKALTVFEPNQLFVGSRLGKNGVLVIDDGKTCNPAGFSAALSLVKELMEKRKLQNTVLITAGIVDLGDSSSSLHSELADSSRPLFEKVLYLGFEGKQEFEKVFGKDFISEVSKIKEILSTLTEDTLVLVEGKVSSYIYEYL